MKVFNVPGAKLRPTLADGKENQQQDLEFNNAPALELGNALICRDIFRLRVKYAEDPEGLQRALKKRDDFEAQNGRNERASRRASRRLLASAQHPPRWSAPILAGRLPVRTLL